MPLLGSGRTSWTHARNARTQQKYCLDTVPVLGSRHNAMQCLADNTHSPHREMVEDESATMMDLVARSLGPDGTPEEAEAKARALEDLSDRVDRIDYAIALHVYAKGFLPLFKIIEETNHDRVRASAAALASLCMRNNDKCQEWALEIGGLATLQRAYADWGHPVDVRKSLLSAVSALVQNNAVGEAAFLRSGGLGVLFADVNGIARGMRIKALFMLQWLLAASQEARGGAIAEAGTLEALAGCVSDEDDEVAELGAMCLQHLLRHGKEEVVGRIPGLKSDVDQRINVGMIGSGEAESAGAALKDLVALL